MNYKVPVCVLSSFEEVPGTLVTEEAEDMERVMVRGVTSIPEAKVSLVGVPDKPGVAAKIFGDIAARNINVDMIIQNVGSDDHNDISFTVSRSDLKAVIAIANDLVKEIHAQKVQSDDKVVKVSAVGVGMRSHSGVAGKMFSALANKGINIQLISTSEIKISCIIAEEYAELAVRALAEEFELENESKELEQ
ncbi:MAG TPA: ACT domain-containing protein [bacterium]|nr:ACT domain-containing protein [bacterium]